MSRWTVFRKVRTNFTGFDADWRTQMFRSDAIVLASGPVRCLLAGNELVTMEFDPSAAIARCSLNLVVRRAFGRHCPEAVNRCPAGQVLPQAAPL
jgi:hypothetical protein